MVQLKKSTTEALPEDQNKVEYADLDVTKLAAKPSSEASPPDTHAKNSEPEGNVLATSCHEYGKVISHICSCFTKRGDCRRVVLYAHSHCWEVEGI